MATASAVGVSGVNWAQVSAALADGPRTIRTQLTRDTSKIGRPIINRMKDAVQATSSSASSSGYASMARGRFAAMRGRSGPMTFASFARYGGGIGLRSSVASTLRMSRRTGGNLMGIRIDSNTGRMPANARRLPVYMDEGSWRHPVLGNRHAWVTQTVTPTGWFTRTAHQSLDDAREAITDSVNRALDEVARHVDAAG